MRKKIFIPFLTLLFFLTAGSRGEAFVPQTPHLLHLMVGKIKVPAGLVVHQVRKVPPEGSGSSADSPGNDTMVALQETLTYLFPGRLRSDVNRAEQFFVVSDQGTVKVDGGRITSTTLSGFDRYIDVLLYRDHERLALRLAEAGVNIEKVTFQRLEGRICYFIGQPRVDHRENPGLWIDKESFFPVRYLLHQGQWTVDVRYEDWQRISRTWYPMSVRILVDGRLFAEISVTSITLDAGASSDLFDVERILNVYPYAKQEGAGHEGRVKALDKELEEFNRLYD